jgi:hypothetical protein
VDLRTLEDFLRVVELGSFSLAAERNSSTQSAFSRRIQGLETWIGATLINRKSNPLRLTPAGEAFKELAGGPPSQRQARARRSPFHCAPDDRRHVVCGHSQPDAQFFFHGGFEKLKRIPDHSLSDYYQTMARNAGKR